MNKEIQNKEFILPGGIGTVDVGGVEKEITQADIRKDGSITLTLSSKNNCMNPEKRNFYCRAWEKDGAYCGEEGQCETCKKAENMPEVIPAPAVEDETFEDYMRNAKNNLGILTIKWFPHEQKPTNELDAQRWTEMRCAVEDMFLCFDQMRQRIASTAPQTESKGVVLESPVSPRRSGRTTRIIDSLVGDFFVRGFAVCEDHEGGEQDMMNRRVADLLSMRLVVEHSVSSAKIHRVSKEGVLFLQHLTHPLGGDNIEKFLAKKRKNK